MTLKNERIKLKAKFDDDMMKLRHAFYKAMSENDLCILFWSSCQEDENYVYQNIGETIFVSKEFLDSNNQNQDDIKNHSKEMLKKVQSLGLDLGEDIELLNFFNHFGITLPAECEYSVSFTNDSFEIKQSTLNYWISVSDIYE